NHAALFDHGGEPSEAGGVARSIDPSGADDRHGRLSRVDHRLEQALAGNLGAAVRVGLRAQRCRLVRNAAYIVAVPGYRADVHESLDTGAERCVDETLQTADVGALVLDVG